MIYEVYDKPSHICLDDVDKILSFGSDFLDLDVDLIFVFEEIDQNEYGFCEYDHDEIMIILSNEISEDDLTLTIFHELVHVKQYHSGKRNVIISNEWCGILCNEDYHNTPWEIEAYDLEKKMLAEFKKTKIFTS